MPEHPAVTIFREYLRIPSVHPDPDYGPCVEFFKKRAAALGLPVSVYGTETKPVVVITWEGTKPELPSIVFNSHMDVVPVYPEKWTYPPFSGHKTDDGKIYGRGSQDMKILAIQYLAAVQKLKAEGFRPRRTIHLLHVPDEEIGGELGMGKFVETQEFKKLNVGMALDEGTSSFADYFIVYNDERSKLALNIFCGGPTGHGSLLHEGTAGEKMRVVLDELFNKREVEQKKMEGRDVFTSIGKATSINLTMIEGGVQNNVIPDCIKLVFDVRLSVEEDQDTFLKWIDVWLAVTASLGYLTIGLVRGWSSPAIPSMKALSPEVAPNDEVISWISAVPPLGAFVGSLFCGPMMQGLGRKKTLFISSPLFAAAWLTIGFSNHWGIIVAARAFSGFCVGIVLPSAQIYVSECSHPKMRGMMGSLPALAMAIGILICYILGTYLSWYALAMASAAFPASLVVLLQFLPESPTWLQTQGRTTEAKAALEWLQRESNIATVELSTIEPPKEVVAALPSNEEKTIRSKKAILSGPYSPDSLLRKPVLVPFGLAVGILVFQQISGIDSIIFYTVSIFQASGSTLGEYESTIIVGAVQVVATFASLLLVDAQGRKALLLTSGITMAVSMAALGAYFNLHNKGEADGLGLLPLFSQLVFIAGFSLGYCNIPFILMGELLPSAQRSLLSSVAGALNLASMFVVIKTFPDLVDLIGSDGTFWLYACLCALSCAFVHFLLPETKGKSLDEIEEYFENMSYNPRIKTDAEKANQLKQETIIMH